MVYMANNYFLCCLSACVCTLTTENDSICSTVRWTLLHLLQKRSPGVFFCSSVIPHLSPKPAAKNKNGLMVQSFGKTFKACVM